MLLGYWTVFPHDLVTNAGLIPFGSTICCYLQVAHMGTIISIKQLAEQWKVIVICMFGLVGMTVLALFLCPMLMDKSFVIAGLPPLTGGVLRVLDTHAFHIFLRHWIQSVIQCGLCNGCSIFR